MKVSYKIIYSKDKIYVGKDLILSILLSLAFILGGMPSTIYADDSTIVVSNESYKLPTAAQIVDGRTMVPIRYIAESLGYVVDWNSDTDPIVVSLIKEGSTIILKKPVNSDVFSSTVNVNGVDKITDVPAQLITSSTCVPVRFISETAGFIVDYYGKTSEIAVMEPSSKGKLILLTLGSKTSVIMQGTYEAGLRRMASRLTGTAKDEVMTLVTKVKADESLKLATSEGATEQGLSSVYPVEYIIDLSSGAQINTLGGTWSQEDITANYGSLPLSETVLGYQIEGKLYYFNTTNYKSINLATAKSTTTKTITFSSDILINSITVNGKTTIQLKNTAGETYNESSSKWEAPPVVRTEAEKKFIEAVKPYIAAGEFMDTADFKNYVETGKNSAIRVYSTSKPSAAEKALFEKFEKTGTTKAEFCDGTNIIGIDGNMSARYNSNKILDSNTNHSVCILELELRYDNSIKNIVTFEKASGRVLKEYNKSTNKLKDLDAFRNLYTPEQYKQKTEQILENDARFKGKYDSKVWLNDAQGQPALCLLVGGILGTTTERVALYQESVNILNELDLGLIKSFREEIGLQLICKMEYDDGGAAILFRRGLGQINVNEMDTYQGKMIKDNGVLILVPLLINESRGINNIDYLNINNNKFIRSNKACNTEYISIEKETYAFKYIEKLAGIKSDYILNLDGVNKVNMFDYYKNIDAGLGFGDSNYGKVGRNLFISSASLFLNDYNNYIYMADTN